MPITVTKADQAPPIWTPPSDELAVGYAAHAARAWADAKMIILTSAMRREGYRPTLAELKIIGDAFDAANSMEAWQRLPAAKP